MCFSTYPEEHQEYQHISALLSALFGLLLKGFLQQGF